MHPRKMGDAETTARSDSGDDPDLPNVYDRRVLSLRSSTGLEIGLQVEWPGLGKPLQLSTVLPHTELAPMFHGTQWAGTRVWTAALVTTDYVLKNLRLSQTSTVLELGCGLGVPGMLLHALRNCDVTLTDMDALLCQLKKNVAANFPRDVRINAHALDWSVDGVQKLLQSMPNNGFDVVLNSDCVYEPLYGLSWEALVECQAEILRQRPSTIMITSVERRTADGVDRYLAKLRQCEAVAHVERIDVKGNHFCPYDIPREIELYRAMGHASDYLT